MEFPTNINKYLKADEQGFLCCNGKTINKLIQQNFFNEGTKMISSIVNQLGANSAKAQALKQIITSFLKFSGSDHRIYIKVQDNKALGFIRVGQKKLFYHDHIGSIKQLTPTCVLDIYVHEKYQRSGIGKEIFQKFLATEGKVPQKLAYDRPSQKLISFLKKHYGLTKYISQNNNYVIFDRYFSKNEPLTKVQSNLPITDTNRFYKFQKKEKPLIQNKNKTFNVIQTKKPQITIKQIKYENTRKKEEKIQDSLTKLQKQMNRMTLNNFKQKIRDQTISSFGCPFATEQNLGFRTTSNTYGNYYKYK